MTSKEFEDFTKGQTKQRLNLNKAKGESYANSEDRLANFKRQGLGQGLRPEQICLVYMTKHFDAITSAIRTDNIFDVSGESIFGRISDLQNYLDLLRAIIFEEYV